MIYLLIVGLIALSGILVYKKRYTSDFCIGGLYFVQLYYLVISPIICGLLIALGQDILNRPSYRYINLPSDLVFNIYSMCVVVAAIASGIHSATTSVYQAFLKNEIRKIAESSDPLEDSVFRRMGLGDKLDKQLPTFHVNEKFHGGFSHNLLFISSIVGLIMLAILELNHPVADPRTLNPIVIIFSGIVMGLIIAIAVIRSAHISLSLITSMIGGGILYYFASKILVIFPHYPVTTVILISQMVLTVALGIVGMIFLLSHRFSKTVVKRLYPKEHWFQEGMSLELMKIKIKRDWPQ